MQKLKRDRLKAYHVNLGTLEDGRQPYDVYSKLVQIVNSRNNALQVASARASRILERSWIDLVDGALLPPSSELTFSARHSD